MNVVRIMLDRIIERFEKIPPTELIYVETSTYCNLSCVHCYRTSKDFNSKNRNMSFDVFMKIIDEIEPYRKYFAAPKKYPQLFLHGLGEPTLNPHLSEMISYAYNSRKVISVAFATNLLAVEKAKYVEYFDRRLTNLYVSLDTLNRGIITNTRKGTDLNRVIDSLGYLSKRYSEQITIITVLSEQNKGEIFSLCEFIKSLNIKRWIIQLINNHLVDHRKAGFGVKSSEVANIKRALLRKSINMSISVEEEHLFKCRQPFTSIVFNVMGFVMPCCAISDHEIINFGKIQESNLYKLYNSTKFKSFRKEFVKQKPTVCENCPYY